MPNPATEGLLKPCAESIEADAFCNEIIEVLIIDIYNWNSLKILLNKLFVGITYTTIAMQSYNIPLNLSRGLSKKNDIFSLKIEIFFGHLKY
jgi:hypothetical protein